ncbi:MFS transporter [Thiotrichales bacterium 19S11-10]|nr:MFS transporter [Thiotrichales bacterium 19S11-10]
MPIDNKQVMKNSNSQLIFIVLLLFMPVVGMAVDLIAPSLPHIAKNLNLSEGLVKGVISLYLLGYALGNFFIGLLTDALGRKTLLRVSLFLFAVFSLFPIVWPEILVLLFSRFAQGLSVGAVAVLIRAIFSDSLPPERLIKLGPVMGAMWGFGPVIGPVIGGYLQFYFNWQANFIFFTLIAVMFLIVIFITVPETITQKQSLGLRQMKKSLIEVLSDGVFMALVIAMGVVYALIITFQTLGPFLIQDVFHYSAAYFGRVALIMGAIFLPATFLCRYLLRYFKVSTLYYYITYGSALLMLMLLMLSVIYPNSFLLLLLTTGLMFFICGFIFPLSMGKGMALFRHISGTAAAVMYLINVLITSAVAFLESFINADKVIEIIIIYAVLVLSLLITYSWKLRYKLED